MVITKESRNFAPLIKNKGEFIMEHLIEERYISLLTDFGFKRIFGSKPNKELHEYEDSLKAYRDIKNSLDTAFEKGHEKGRDERSIEIASALLAEGISIEKIMHCTGLTEDQIKKLKS
mgnify:FL=1